MLRRTLADEDLDCSGRADVEHELPVTALTRLAAGAVVAAAADCCDVPGQAVFDQLRVRLEGDYRVRPALALHTQGRGRSGVKGWSRSSFEAGVGGYSARGRAQRSRRTEKPLNERIAMRLL